MAQMKTILPGRLYWAAPGRFTRPGVHLWLLGRHWRVVPVPRLLGKLVGQAGRDGVR